MHYKNCSVHSPRVWMYSVFTTITGLCHEQQSLLQHITPRLITSLLVTLKLTIRYIRVISGRREILNLTFC